MDVPDDKVEKLHSLDFYQDQPDQQETKQPLSLLSTASRDPGQYEELAGDEDDNKPVSPMLGIGWLLKFYNLIGAFPAEIRDDYSKFDSHFKHYRKTLFVAGLILLGFWAAHKVEKSAELKERKFHKGTFMRPPNMTSFDILTRNLVTQGTLVFATTTVFFNHRMLQHLDPIIDYSSFARHEVPDPQKQYLHHFLVLGLVFFRESLLNISVFTISPYDFYAFILVFFCSAGQAVLINIVIELPALLIVRVLHVLTVQLDVCRDRLSERTIEPSEYIMKIERIFRAFKMLGKVFGKNVIVLMTCYVVHLIFSFYFMVIMFCSKSYVKMGTLGHMMHELSYFSFFAVTVKRLTNFTAFIQKFIDQIEDAKEELAGFETNPHYSVQARRLLKLLKRIEGLPAEGYFWVDRSILADIVGHLLTYVIILIEFKLDE